MAWLVAEDAARWLRITSGPFTWGMWADIVDATHHTVPTPRLPITSADLSVSGGPVRHAGKITVPAVVDDGRGPVDWTPRTWDAPLSPFGNRLRLWAGVDNGDENQIVDLGLWLIMTVTVKYPGDTVEIDLGDLAEELVQARVSRDVPTGEQTGWSQARLCQHVVDLAGVPRRPQLQDPQGWLSANPIPDETVFNAGSSAWDMLQELVSVSDPDVHVYVDRNGNLRVWREDLSETLPPPASAVFVLGDGFGGHLVALESTLSRRGAINAAAVIVEDSNVDTDASAITSAAKPPAVVNEPDWDEITKQYLMTIADTVRLAAAEVGTGRNGNGTVKYQFAFPQFGSSWVEYCGIFVAWLLGPNQKIPTPVPGKNWVSILAYVPTAKALLRPFLRTDAPRVGDIILFGWEHAGIVEDTSGWPNYVTTIEGNVGNRVVRLRRYPSSWLGGGTPGGFVSPDYTRLSGFGGSAGPPVRSAGALQRALDGDWSALARQFDGDPADTSQTGDAFLLDGSPLDFNTGTLGRATVVDVSSRKDPAAGFAAARAKHLLDTRRGAPRTLSAQTTPQPWLNPSDVVRIEVAGRSEVVRVDSWRLSVDADGQLSFTVAARGWHAWTQAQAALPKVVV